MKQNAITRKNLIYSLITGLVIGVIAGIPMGWYIHQFYAEQRLADTLICREKNKDLPEAQVRSICGSRF